MTASHDPIRPFPDDVIANVGCVAARGRTEGFVGSSRCFGYCRVPTDTGKMRQLFPIREKSGNFEKMSKSQGILNESGKSKGKL